jgi:hypothetical protein
MPPWHGVHFLLLSVVLFMMFAPFFLVGIVDQNYAVYINIFRRIGLSLKMASIQQDGLWESIAQTVVQKNLEIVT